MALNSTVRFQLEQEPACFLRIKCRTYFYAIHYFLCLFLLVTAVLTLHYSYRLSGFRSTERWIGRKRSSLSLGLTLTHNKATVRLVPVRGMVKKNESSYFVLPSSRVAYKYYKYINTVLCCNVLLCRLFLSKLTACSNNYSTCHQAYYCKS